MLSVAAWLYCVMYAGSCGSETGFCNSVPRSNFCPRVVSDMVGAAGVSTAGSCTLEAVKTLVSDNCNGTSLINLIFFCLTYI